MQEFSPSGERILIHQVRYISLKKKKVCSIKSRKMEVH